MRMKYTMPPYPNTHVYFYNGRTPVIKEGRDQYVEFDPTVNRSWERLLWQEGFRPVDEEGKVTMKQSPKSAPMQNLPQNDDAADIDHKESIDPGVLAGNNAEFQELHADELKEQDEAAESADNAEESAPADPSDAAAFGLTEEEALEHEESNSGDPDSKPATGAASVEEAPILAVEEEYKEEEEKPAPRRRGRKAADNKE